MVTLPESIKEEVEKYLKEHKITGSRREKIIKVAKEVYKKCLYEPEEPIGVVTAQSLSEPTTQMTMRTYHFAGTAGIQVTLGLPRMMEIFDARREPRTPTMTVYILPE